MRIALLNLRYSPNLGDVLLCECLEYGIRKSGYNLDVIQVDITGRQKFSPASSRRLAALVVLQKLPLFVRQTIARVVLGRSLRRIAPLWRSLFATVQAAVLGGGNLLADADLNFPLKISAVLRVIAEKDVPLAVYGIGVSDNWTPFGQSLFRRALAGVRIADAAVRDQRSQAIWRRRLGSQGLADPRIVRDPGFLAAECYPRLPKPPSPGRRVGLCITHPEALSYHADEPVPNPTELKAWFLSLTTALTSTGDAVFLFTTGSPEDELYLTATLEAFKAHPKGVIERIPRFESASHMAGFLSTLDLILAHRLHACIVAYAFGIPHIGFTWDQKMRSFFDSVDRGEYIVPAGRTNPVDFLTLVDSACRKGIEEKARSNVVLETHREIGILLQRLGVS